MKKINPKNFQNILRGIRSNPGGRNELFATLPPNQQAQACLILSKYLVYDLLSKISDRGLVTILEHLDPDEATDILQMFSKDRQRRLLAMVKEEIKTAIETLIKFDPDTAAGLMDVDYIQVNESDTIVKVARQFKIHEKRTGRLPVIIVLRDDCRLAGYLPGHELGFARPNDRAKKYVRKISTVSSNASREETIEVFRSYPHAKVAVIGSTGQVMGIIYSDDVLRLIHEKEAESLYDFAGVSKEESVFDSASSKIKFRYKWLVINLGTAFLASFTVSLFDATISKYVLLAVYMPIIAGMGGNAATQTMAVTVRGIALRQIDLESYFQTLKNEILSGLANGVINGVIVAAIVITINQNMAIALILAMAMVINLVVAAFFGTIIPLVMKRLGKDPASSATIFITTATDVLGFLAFLGLAALLLP